MKLESHDGEHKGPRARYHRVERVVDFEPREDLRREEGILGIPPSLSLASPAHKLLNHRPVVAPVMASNALCRQRKALLQMTQHVFRDPLLVCCPFPALHSTRSLMAVAMPCPKIVPLNGDRDIPTRVQHPFAWDIDAIASKYDALCRPSGCTNASRCPYHHLQIPVNGADEVRVLPCEQTLPPFAS